MGRKKVNIEPILKDGDVVVLYKKGSRGEVVGIYENVKDIVEMEKPFNESFSSVSVYKALTGHRKYFRSFNHQCRVLPRIRKRETVENFHSS